ncbi:MAG TPA: peptidoglycan DD-metalloendopeptidase family protein [Terriglobales bacterium]|nr:peptidoglycan DD-metalloendopeptidase family protein [Terriglobales bacterium]
MASLLVIGCEGAWLAGAVQQRRASEALLAQENQLARQDVPNLAARRLTSTDQKIPPRTTFSQFMEGQGIAAATVQELIQESRAVYDLARVRAGNKLTLVSSISGQLKQVRYQIDQDQVLWITRQKQHFDARIRQIPYIVRVAGITGTVSNSLFQAVETQGEGDELAVGIADIFGWDIDFNTDPRSGDTFEILFERKRLNGQQAGYGRILAAEYKNGDHLYQAVLFHDPSGRPAYYAPSGKSMQKAFLRSPLRFAARITSGFSYPRFHPILERTRPHLGTDYGAPVGSSVQAVADGTVVYAGWKGEDGKLVLLRHAHGYETYYMHLSRTLVRPGQHVQQGQIIALTGATGLATGPHLDFRIKQNGSFRNFLALDLPPAQAVAGNDRLDFEKRKTQLLDELAALHAHPAGVEQASLQALDPRAAVGN